MLKLTENAKAVLNRFLARDKQGKIIETPERMFSRIAKNIAKEDKKYNQNPAKAEKEFYNAMTNLEFLPNVPILANAGRSLQQLAACFVIPVPDSIEGIFQALKEMAIIQKTGGGTGFSFSRLRPESSIVGETGGIASGPVSFMNVFDCATGAIKEGGIRRGANMGVLDIKHPDIEKFITCKDKGGFPNFNISVGITEKFMSAVKQNKSFSLIFNKKVYKTLAAKKLFDLVMKHAWLTGDPGILFIDEINKHNPTPQLGKIEATNPCLTKDDWILTNNVPCQIKDVINKKISLAKDGKFYTTEGFFSTGKKEVFKIITKEGYEIKATENHLFLTAKKITRYKINTAWKELKELSQNDILILGNNRNIAWKSNGNLEEGYLLGLLFGDGYLTKEKGIISIWKTDYGSLSILLEAERIARRILSYRKDFQGFQKENFNGVRNLKLKSLKELAEKYGLNTDKQINSEIECASFEFYKGFLRGFFDTDGSVQGSQNKGISIRLWQNNLDTLKAVQRMLQRIGIISSLYKRKGIETKMMPDGKKGKKLYTSKEGYELIISGDNILVYHQKIGFVHEAKKQKLENAIKAYKRKLNKERFLVRVKEILKVGSEEVYDIHVPEINSF